jgi:hypothetical protein
MRGRVLAGFGLACPLSAVAVVLLMRAGAIRFTDDFYGFRGLGFLLGWLAAAVPLGLLASGTAVWLDRRSRFAVAAAALNALFAAAGLYLLASLAF